MSGFEVAGLGLALLPLLLKAVDKYSKALRSIASYSSYCEEVEDYKYKIIVQRQIFRNHCAWLLSQARAQWLLDDSTSGSNGVIAMDEEDELRIDSEISSCLGAEKETFLLVLQRIGNILSVLHREIEPFDRILRQRPPNDENVYQTNQSWRRQFTKRLCFAFTKTKIADYTKQLKTYNQSLLGLRQSSASFEVSSKQSKESDSNSISSRDLELFNHAATDLYHNLQRVSNCSVESHHSVNMSLEEDPARSLLELRELSAKGRLKFNMDLVCGEDQNTDLSTSVSLHIETNSKQHLSSSGPIREESLNSKRQAPDDPYLGLQRSHEKPKQIIRIGTRNSNRKSPKMDVRDAILSTTLETNQSTLVLLKRSTQGVSYSKNLNLMKISDLCAYLRTELQIGIAKLGAECLGYFQNEQGLSHIIYRQPTDHLLVPLTSLNSILSNLSNSSPYTGLLPYDRIRLARILSTLVLKFGATPWLSQMWSTKDVLMAEPILTRDATKCVVKNIKLHVNNFDSRFQGIKTNPATMDSTYSMRHNTISPVQEPILFRLGVALAEICLQSTLSYFRVPEDLDDSPLSADYVTYMRLEESLNGPLGMKFGRIIRKCVRCDFGIGVYKLSDPKLQVTFYKDVVQELEKLESLMRRLNIDDN